MERRVIVIFFVFICLFMVVSVRLYTISTDKEALASNVVGNKVSKFTLSKGRGYILDRNFNKITNSESEYIVLCNPAAVLNQRALLSECEDTESVRDKLKKGKPFLITLNKNISLSGCDVFYETTRYSKNQPAVHLVGYIDSKGHGVLGLEKVFDDILYIENSDKVVSIEVDALGRSFYESRVKTTMPDTLPISYVKTTLDLKMQKITEKALKEHNIMGCAVLCEVKTGKILALASFPGYDYNNIQKAIDENKGGLLNKAFSSYNCGSIFKIVTATAALRLGKQDFEYNCTGSITVGSNTISCYNKKAHGNCNMSQAMAKSCNCYFIALSQQIGYEDVWHTANIYKFGESVELYEGYKSKEGYLPSKQQLSMPAELANFSIGQGKLMVTPLQVLNMVNVIANEGMYNPLSIIESYCDNEGKVTDVLNLESKRLLHKEVAQSLKELMIGVTQTGTGKVALPEVGGAGTKTSTAQTGIIVDGRYIARVWIGGFFPKDNPKYSLVILNEDGINGAESAAPVFKQIADEINEKFTQ